MVSRRFITFLMRFIKLMRFVLLKERKASNIKRRGSMFYDFYSDCLFSSYNGKSCSLGI